MIWLEFRLSQGNVIDEEFYLYSIGFDDINGNIYFTSDLNMKLITDNEIIKQLAELFCKSTEVKRNNGSIEDVKEEIGELVNSVDRISFESKFEF